jgi:methionyl-tRNA formyltransferase
MKIVFAGTPEFAVPPLEALLAGPHEIAAVYAQPDRPAGRGRKLAAGPVKDLALSHSIPVFQPTSLKDPEEQERLRLLAPDLLVVVAYGLILPKAVLDIPRIGCINIHGSLLPRWRGAAPIQRAVQAGDPETGVTIMFLEPKMDAGPMLLKKSCPIDRHDTAGELYARLSRMGAEALSEILPSLEAGTVRPEIQDEALVTYASKLEKDEASLDWSRPAAELERQVMAFNPWPVAETIYRGEILRVWRAEALPGEAGEAPGTVLPGAGTFDVATGRGVLRLTEIQLPGGKRLQARDFLNAHSVRAEILGTRP